MYEKYLNDHIKVDGRTGNAGEILTIKQIPGGKIEIVSHQDFSGRYLKYLTKKHLKKQQARDWLRLVSTSRGTYQLRYFGLASQADEEEEDDE